MKPILLVLLLIPAFVGAQSVRKTNRRLTSEYNSVKDEYDSIFSIYKHKTVILEEIKLKTSQLFVKELLEKTNRLDELQRKVWKAASDLRMVYLMNTNFPGFPSQRLDSIGPDYVKMGQELRAIEFDMESDVSAEEKDFTFKPEGISIKVENDSLQKLLLTIRSEIKFVLETNERIDKMMTGFIQIDRLKEGWLREIDQMIAYIESYGAPVVAKRDEIKRAVQANPDAFDEEYRKVFARVFDREKEERFISCGFGIEIGESRDKVFDTYISTEFPGGCNSLLAFLSKNLVLPQSIREKGAVIWCHVGFNVSESGEISNIETQKNIPNCPECNDEAIRVIKLMPKWVPGMDNGKPVNSYFILPIQFKL